MIIRMILVLCLLVGADVTLAADIAEKVLVVGSEQNFPPFAIGETDETADGFTVDLWRVVAREAGLKYTIRVRPWGQILQEFKDGKIDVLINVAQSDDRHQYTDFSVSHVTVNGAIFVRTDDSRIRSEGDLAGKSIIVFKSDLAHEYAVSKGWQAQLVVVDTAKDGLKLLASGRHDAMLLSKLAGMKTIKALDLKNIKALDAKVGYAQKFSFGVHRGDAELLARLNEGLALAKASGAYDSLYQKWFGIYEIKEPTFKDMLKYLLPFAGFAVCLVLYFIYRRGIERKQAEDALRESKQRLDTILENVGACIFIKDTRYRYIYVNRKVCELFGKSEQDIIGKDDTAFFSAGSVEEIMRSDRVVIEQGETVRREETDLTVAANQRHTYWTVKIPLRDNSGVIYGLCGISTDISERKALEDSLHEQALRLEDELAERQSAQEALQDQAAILEEEIEERIRIEQALQQSEATIRNKLSAILEPEGDIGSLELSDIIDCEMLRSLLEDFYKLTGILGAVLDVSGKVLVAVGWQDICTKFHRCHPESLKNCRESDTILTNGVPVGTFKQYRCKNNMWDMVTPLEVGGRHVGNIFIGQFFYEDEPVEVELFREQARHFGFDESEYLAALERVPRISRETAEAGMRFYSKLTKMISSLSFSSIKVSRMLSERIKLEEQLRQSQKMEAIGLLAGGVAHDFNNILTVIMGYCALLEMDSKLDPKIRDAAEHIMSSTEKAAQLTKGLLAFSRKQVLAVKNENLNDILHNVEKFIARIIGEDILLKSVYNGRELPVNVDASQIEQVLINLATNARDAMPRGGSLMLETSFQEITDSFQHAHGYAKPGPYACITVSDTGYGISEENRSKIFEPFFTTKEIGKGTGLGMAIAYGIIQQHNGFINVYSELGMGTTVRIYLPLAEAQQSCQTEENTQAGPQGGSETILLAEDDASVRNLTVTVLSTFGYKVIQAVDGLDAIDKFREHQNEIKLILMDMIMPKMNGKDAYDQISKIRPGVKVLYSSGYTADFIQNRGVSEDDIELLMKPVQPLELLRKIREMLDH